MMNKISRFFKNKSAGDDFSVSENFTTINDNVSFAVREAYKTLRTNVIFSLPAAEGRVIGVTSANKGEGKSTSAINLALSIAETGKRVLFLDCDLRLSHIAERLKLKASPGVSNILVGLSSIEESIQRFSDEIDVITAGDVPPNPAELLDSKQMENFCSELTGTHKYDYVIVDLPPIGIVSDALIMSKNLDGIIVVVRQDYSAGDSIRDSVRKLQFIDSKILGFILNDHKERRNKRYGYGKKYGYQYGYEYGYGSEPDEQKQEQKL